MTASLRIICNSLANHGRAVGTIEKIRSKLARQPEIEWCETTHPGHAVDLARLSAGAERIIVIGGDGSIHEVVNGLMSLPANQRPTLGIIPAGSGNDFAVSLNIPPDIDSALSLALNGIPHGIDVGCLSDDQGRCEYWTNSMGIGFDAITILYSKRIRLLSGFLMYFAAVMETILFKHIPMHAQMTLDNRPLEEDLILFIVGNGKQEGGGFRIAPHARLDDGKLDLLGMRSISRLRMLATLPAMMNGKHDHLKFAMHEQFTELHLTSDRPLIIQTDGEIFSGFNSIIHAIDIKTCRQAVQIMTPAVVG